MIPVDFCQKKKYEINITNDVMVSKFIVFENHKLKKNFKLKAQEYNGFKCYMNTGMKKTHPTKVPLVYGHIGCFNIMMSFQ